MAVWPPTPATDPPPYFAALNELFANEDRLWSCEDAACEATVLEVRNLEALYNEHFDAVAGDAYGEQTHLFELIDYIRTFHRVRKPSKIDVARARFQVGFLIWYTMPKALPYLSENQKSVYFWKLPLKNCAPSGSYVIIDKHPVNCFDDYLGYLD